MKQKRLYKKRVYKHPPEVVWHALTDRAALSEWMMPNDFEARVGHRFQFRFDPVPGVCPADRTLCEVLELDAPRRMVWSWQEAPTFNDRRPPAMRVEWVLTPVDGGTQLELIQTGVEGQKFITRFMMSIGWYHMLRDQLPKILSNVALRDGVTSFEPGAIPLRKRAYKIRTVPPELLSPDDQEWKPTEGDAR